MTKRVKLTHHNNEWVKTKDGWKFKKPMFSNIAASIYNEYMDSLEDESGDDIHGTTNILKHEGIIFSGEVIKIKIGKKLGNNVVEFIIYVSKVK